MELKLEAGKEYVVTHKRKGTFEGRLLKVVKTPAGDKVDKQFLTFEIDTSPGSGQERIARVQNARITVTNIRPSLIVSIVPSTRSPKLPEPEPKEVEPMEESFWDKIRKRLRKEI